MIGAGPTGSLVAQVLSTRGHRVLLLEAGPRIAPGHRTPDVDRRAWAYKSLGRSFDWYRVRALGGRSLLWGGWTYRFPDVVFRRGGWPYGRRTLEPYYRRAECMLGVVQGTLDERYRRVARSLGLTLMPKRGAVSADGQVWTPLSLPMARRARTLQVVLRLEHTRGRATVATVLDLDDGSQRSVRARTFVLAASPIETTRILLSSELGRHASRIGRGLVDHMVASFVLLEPAPPDHATHGPFPGSALVESFVNVGKGTERAYPGGFSIELSGPVPLEALNLERLVPGDEIHRWRATQIHAIGELFPHPRRYVDLDPTERDALDRPVPRIHVAWSRADRRMASDLREVCINLADELAIPQSRVIPFTDPLQFGAGHEAGTCAMGRDDSFPCDPWGRLRALDNVWVADASVMPTAGDRHPTLTLLAHALRAADSVSRFLGGRTDST